MEEIVLIPATTRKHALLVGEIRIIVYARQQQLSWLTLVSLCVPGINCERYLLQVYLLFTLNDVHNENVVR